MRVFILEDDPVRHKIFKERYKNEELVIADGYWQAISTLASSEPFDLFCLDHDLGLTGSSSSEGFNGFTRVDKNGNDFVDHFLSFSPKEKWPKNIVVHSWNPPGAKEMVKKLTEAGIKTVYEMFNHRP